jgi:integrase
LSGLGFAVRRRISLGEVGDTKTRHSRRDVPLSPAMLDALREAKEVTSFNQDGHPVFPNLRGDPMHPQNAFRRVYKPAAVRAGVPWAGWHTLRHTCATRLFRAGLNIVQVSRWLGHHSPAFTMNVYVHYLEADVPDAAFLDALDASGGDAVVTRPTETDRDGGGA